MKLFSEREIIDIFTNHVQKPDSYYLKYEQLPLHLNNRNWKWEGKDFPRIWAILDLQEWLKKHGLGHFKKVLSTCITDPEMEMFTCDVVHHAPYQDGVNDLHTLNLQDKDYDLVVFNQTLEHLYNPFICVENLYKHMAKGGYLFTSVPTINIPHMVPFHYNGLTPMGLATLMMSVGFEILEVGFWGNMDYIRYIFETGMWPDYQILMRDGRIRNERGRHAQCWILVRK